VSFVIFGMVHAKPSKFLILFEILMTRHLQLPAGQIHYFLTYIVFPKHFEISNSVWNSHDLAFTASC
jgi:hypothetical protein